MARRDGDDEGQHAEWGSGQAFEDVLAVAYAPVPRPLPIAGGAAEARATQLIPPTPRESRGDGRGN
jgi:hypothetical protein